MRNNFNSFFPKVLEETFDTIFNTSLGDFVGSDFNLSSPSVNIIEENARYRIELAAPGLSKEDFNIEIDEDRMKISSKKESSTEESSEDGNYLRREFNYQSFVRSFTLPKTVNKENIDAKYEDGILKINLTKNEEEVKKGPKTINIS